MANTTFLGFNDFIWFNGVVEDRLDPYKIGRVRVRCLGIHTHDKEVLPTADLPWAQVVLPVTSPGISGLGSSPSFLLQGSWVFGYFRDGTDCQEPVVLGSIPGRPLQAADTSKGFSDPTGEYPLLVGVSDVNRLATNEEGITHPQLDARMNVATGIPTADFNKTKNAKQEDIPASDGTTWDQPEITYNAEYPFNKVYESEAGHIFEIDDTAGAERIYQSHVTGTSYEINPEGNIVYLNVGDKYEITNGKQCQAIGGTSDITIDGRHKIFINKKGESNNNYDIQIGPGANVNIQVDKGNINLVTVEGDVNVNSGGNYNLKVKGNYSSVIEGYKSEIIEGTKTSKTTGHVKHYGSIIDLNPAADTSDIDDVQ